MTEDTFVVHARVERRLAAILAADVAGYSRLMGDDEEGTLAGLKAHRRELVDHKLKSHRGRLIKTTGDGMLVEFSSAVEAVKCAVEVQRGMVTRNASIPPDRRIEFRVGINVGDIIEDEGDIFGDGVNVAARLEGMAVRGGICISRQVLDQIDGKLKLPFRELGRQNLKNIARPIEVYAIDLDKNGSPAARVLSAANLKQDIRYCRATDGVRLAYATVGSGPGLLKSAHWLGHLEYDWDLPLYRDFLLGLASSFTLVRYDARGNGLSDWDVGELSLDAWVKDMESVADAAGLDRFPLLGFSQGCAVSIAFAVRHPERVSHLILYGGFAVGANKNPNLSAADRERFAAMKTLMKLGWGADEPTFRQLFTSSMLPTATKEQVDAFNELQRLSASAESAVRYLETVANFDVRPLLKQIKAPTLVMHVRDDRRVPISSGRDMAAEIPGARFVSLPGQNHMLLSQDPGAPIFQEEVRNFLL
ncbi:MULTISPECIES: alpha/beta fold hydrolase [Bradyrhizobium]|uniref:alpha/beta fold hydrolase n=1 Tax=Bradyrhizobium TaxID=374 RepID=UPI001FE1BA98|nr:MULTISPECIES: alpha/beta fold hydrolase [Bradyrhizobium]